MATQHLATSQNNAQKLIGSLAFSSFSLEALNFGVFGLGRPKRLSLGSMLFSFTLKLRFKAPRIACRTDLHIHGPYSKDVLSLVHTSLIFLFYSSSVLLKYNCCERLLTGCMSQYPSKEKLYH